MQFKAKIIAFLLVLTLFFSFVSAEPNITIISDNLPSYINSGIQEVIIYYEPQWNLNSETKIRIKTINNNDQTYFPKDIQYKIDNKEISIKETKKINSELETTLIISSFAKEGYGTINVSVIDDKTIEKKINYKIVKNKDIIKYLIPGVIGISVIVIIMTAILIDKR